MKNVGDWITLGAAVLGVVGLLAAAAAVIRSSSVKANLELLRGEVSDLTASNARLAGENVQLKQEVSVLRDLVTSRADVDRLVAEMASMTAAMHADHQAMMLAIIGGGGTAVRRIDQ